MGPPIYPTEVFESIIIQVQPTFEHEVGDVLLLLEQSEGLREDSLIAHHGPFPCTIATWGQDSTGLLPLPGRGIERAQERA